MYNILSSSLTNLTTSLTSISLVGCGLKGNFPENIFCLPDLEMRSLRANFDLTGNFPQANWISPLRFLDVSDTSFPGKLPDLIKKVKSLIYLVLFACNFTGSIGYLTQLRLLDLSHNKFSGRIPSLSNLEHLNFLYLSDNNFTGEIPDIFVNLSQLYHLDFSKNKLVGPIPSRVSAPQNLVTIYLENNLMERYHLIY